MEQALTFDDVLIRPQFSDIESRDEIDTSVDFLGLKLRIPIISANMDYVTGSRMAKAMYRAGGLGILHRFQESAEELYDDITDIVYHNVPLAVSMGVKNHDSWLGIYEPFLEVPNRIICVDVAHGDHTLVLNAIDAIKKSRYDVKIIAGNVATAEGALRLIATGADAIKVGIGPGSVCTTRQVTGVGVPQFSAIQEVARVSTVPVIADGGIKNSGDIVKALGAGADLVMLGSLLAGTQECPGEPLESPSGARYRPYRGQSLLGINGKRMSPEGISGLVEEKGPVENILKTLTGGIRSGLSYVGARNIREFQSKVTFNLVTPNAMLENGTRVKERV